MEAETETVPLHRLPCRACGDTLNPGGNPYFSFDPLATPDGSDCPDCNGTGYRFWMLGAECQGWESTNYDQIIVHHGPHPNFPFSRCACNDGSGRIAAYDVAGLLEAGKSQGWEIEVGSHGRWWSARIWFGDKGRSPRADMNLPGATPEEALRLALEAAVAAAEQSHE